MELSGILCPRGKQGRWRARRGRSCSRRWCHGVYTTCARARDVPAKRNNGREIDEGGKEGGGGGKCVRVCGRKYGGSSTRAEREEEEEGEEAVDTGGELQSVPDGPRAGLRGYHFTVPSPVNPPRCCSPSREPSLSPSLSAFASLPPSNLSTSGATSSARLSAGH